jgi:hypothetical protein
MLLLFWLPSVRKIRACAPGLEACAALKAST